MRTALIIALALASLSSVAAQPTLIKLNAAAVDDKGEPVTDLGASEVSISEDGRPRNLAFFRFSGMAREISPPAPGEFANHPSPVPIVILLDRWNERMGTTAAAWVELRQTLARMETVEGQSGSPGSLAEDPGNLGLKATQQNLIDNIPGAKGQAHTRLSESSHFLQEDQGPEIARLLNQFMESH